MSSLEHKLYPEYQMFHYFLSNSSFLCLETLLEIGELDKSSSACTGKCLFIRV